MKLKINKKIYVEYPKLSARNYYNEIYEYIEDNNKMPNRLAYTKKKIEKQLKKKGLNLGKW